MNMTDNKLVPSNKIVLINTTRTNFFWTSYLSLYNWFNYMPVKMAGLSQIISHLLPKNIASKSEVFTQEDP